MTRRLALGTMSGTSLDGIDVALMETDGERVFAFGPSGYRPYAEHECTLLREALAQAVSLEAREARPGALAAADALVTRAHGDAIETFLAAHTVAHGAVAVVGFHGQTVLHRPAHRLTVQIGDGAALARRLMIPVVHDFRAADVAAGGQGAPLVPAFHAALAADLDMPRPLAVLNVGGVANVTWIGRDGDLVACDTGPGNAAIDDFVRARTGASCDQGGVLAAVGTIDEGFLARALSHPFFAAKPPKSLDRQDFARLAEGVASLPTSTGAATLTALTARAVAAVVPLLPEPPRTWIVAGGGAHNATLMRMLAEALSPVAVMRAVDLGWNADALEAQAFAHLAVRTLEALPITFPGTTGVAAPATGGVLAWP